MSYFAKPNFIVYDEWFDNDFERTKLDVKNQKIKSITNIHDFYYEQSNYKIGASENNFQLDKKVNKKEIIINNFLEKTSEKYTLVSNKKFWFLEKLTKSKLKFNITKKLIYSLSIFGFVFIFVFLLFFISHSRKNESNITNKSLILEKKFLIS